MAKKVYAPINNCSAVLLMDLFDACYKMGVKDAIDVDNEMQCAEFCEEMYSTEAFGRIIYSFRYDWREWKFRLCQMVCDLDRFRAQGLRYFESMGSYNNYIACALPIAMDFYMMGIKDYCKKPNPIDLVRFEHTPYSFWGQTGGRKTTRDDFVTVLTGFCYDRIRLDEAAIAQREQRMRTLRAQAEGKRGRFTGKTVKMPVGLSRSCYESFQSEIWRYTRKRANCSR